MCDCRHVSQDAAEAVKQWRRAAYDIFVAKEHPITYAFTVVEDGTVGQAGGLGRGCGTRGKLNIDDIVWLKVLIHRQTIRYTLFEDLIIVDEWL